MLGRKVSTLKVEYRCDEKPLYMWGMPFEAASSQRTMLGILGYQPPKLRGHLDH